VLVLVGAQTQAGAVKEMSERLGVADSVIGTGWIDSERFLRAPAAADLGVVVRTPSAGETSAAALRFVACGTPVLVSGRAQFLELEERAAPRVTPGPSARAEVARWVVRLARQPNELAERRRAARDLYERCHTLGRSAQRLASWLEEL
jgi:glycosyltransferase involved in cell wall biosynthesis